MGNYMYALRAPSIQRTCNVKTPEGSLAKILVAQYKCVYRSERLTDSQYSAIVWKMENRWLGRATGSFFALQEDHARFDGLVMGMDVFAFPKKESGTGLVEHIPLCFSLGDDVNFKLNEIGFIESIWR